MRFDEVVIQGERLLISLLCLRRPAGAMTGEAEVIPRLRVGFEQRGGDRQPKPLDRRHAIAAIQQPFAVEQGPRSRRRASDQRDEKRQEEEQSMPEPIFCGQHQ